MSSFVIEKREFIKAAGLLYGYERRKRHDSWQWFLDTIKGRMTECYINNVKSVAEQYGEKEEFDNDTYDDTFKQYADFAERSAQTVFNPVRYGLLKFFSSVNYQVENEELAKECKAIFFDCLKVLFGGNRIKDYWGDIPEVEDL